MSQQPVSFPLFGGLDLVTPAVQIPPGRVISSLNYEPTSDGYRRVQGYERFDGRTAPSAGGTRANITAVPGSGPIRGIYALDNGAGAARVVAFRDNAGGTAGVPWRSSTGGWIAGSIAAKLTFTSGGTAEPVVNQFVRDPGNPFVNHGLILSITLTSGSWAAGDAAGFMMILQVGAFAAGNLDLYTGNNLTQANILTVAADAVDQTFSAGGSYEFISHNFFGAENLRKVYGVNGVDSSFVYDENSQYFLMNPVPGMDTATTFDKPDHVAEHNGALFLSYPGGSIQFSAAGDPHSFNPVLGAGELSIGSDVTALVPATNSALAILAEDRIGMLYGYDSSDYQLQVLTDEAGAIANTAQRMGQLIYLDNGGLRTIGASAAFGNFRVGSISRLIAPLLEEYRKDGVDPATSFRVRRADQYWLLFDNGDGVVGCFSKKDAEFLKIDLGFTATCSASVEIEGVERVFIGADDGFVYELNKGTSFDGAVIPHHIELPYHSFGSPQMLKRGHKVTLDLKTDGTTTLTAELRFDNGAVDGVAAQNLVVTNGSGDLDIAECYFGGVFRNASLKIAGSTSTEEPHTLTATTFHISPRGLKR